MKKAQLFDTWPERYEKWFKTPIGRLIQKSEGAIIGELLDPQRKDYILDVGCGTGIFTLDILAAGARVTGLELSLPMLRVAAERLGRYPFEGVQGDMRRLPFGNECFDRVVSITAIEFVPDARSAVEELFRVTRPGGTVVLASLNSLSPWAARRKANVEKTTPMFLRTLFTGRPMISKHWPLTRARSERRSFSTRTRIRTGRRSSRRRGGGTACRPVHSLRPAGKNRRHPLPAPEPPAGPFHTIAVTCNDRAGTTYARSGSGWMPASAGRQEDRHSSGVPPDGVFVDQRTNFYLTMPGGLFK